MWLKQTQTGGRGYPAAVRRTALLTALVFAWPSNLGAADGALLKGTVSAAGAQNPSAGAGLPAEIGTIQEDYRGSGNGLRVILVQDAHAVPEAQRNIRGIIDHFQKTAGLEVIALEGAAAGLDPQIFRSYPDQKALAAVLGKFAAKGELAGSAQAAILNEIPAVYEGIEEVALYEEGIGLYQAAMRGEAVLTEKIAAEERNLEARKEEIFSPELLGIDRALRGFRKNRISLPEALTQLAGVRPPEAGSELGVLLAEIRREGGAPADIEAEVRRAAQKVMDHFRSAPPSPDKRGWMRSFNEKYQEFRTSAMSAPAFALYVRETAARLGMPMPVSGRLIALTRDQKKMRDIEGTKFYRDFENYAASVKAALFRNEDEKSLDRRSETLELMDRLARLKLSREDWDRVKGLPGETLGADFQAHLAFYRNTESRDRVFFENVKALAGRRRAGTVLVVTGGFHTQALTARLKAGKIGYLLVMPKIGILPDSVSYEDHMRGNISWRDYFEIENGRINLYKAFVRAVRDALLKEEVRKTQAGNPFSDIQPSDPRVLKSWRDQIIRDLAAQERAGEAGRYTVFIDEVRGGKNGQAVSALERRLAKVDEFIEGLRRLDSAKQLDPQNILRLLNPAAIFDLYAHGALVDRTVPADLALGRRPAGDTVALPVKRSEVRMPPAPIEQAAGEADEFRDLIIFERGRLLQEKLVPVLVEKTGTSEAVARANVAEMLASMPLEHIQRAQPARLVFEIAVTHVLRKLYGENRRALPYRIYFYNPPDAGHTEFYLVGKNKPGIGVIIEKDFLRAKEPGVLSVNVASSWGGPADLAKPMHLIYEVQNAADLAHPVPLTAEQMQKVLGKKLRKKAYELVDVEAILKETGLDEALAAVTKEIEAGLPRVIATPAVTNHVLMLEVRRQAGFVDGNEFITEKVATGLDNPRQRAAKIEAYRKRFQESFQKALNEVTPEEGLAMALQMQMSTQAEQIAARALSELEKGINPLHTFRAEIGKLIDSATDPAAQKYLQDLKAKTEEAMAEYDRIAQDRVQDAMKLFEDAMQALRQGFSYLHKATQTEEGVTDATQFMVADDIAGHVRQLVQAERKPPFLVTLEQLRKSKFIAKAKQFLTQLEAIAQMEGLSDEEKGDMSKVFESLLDGYATAISLIRLLHNLEFPLPSDPKIIEEEKLAALHVIGRIETDAPEAERSVLAYIRDRLPALIVPGGENTSRIVLRLAGEYAQQGGVTEDTVRQAAYLFMYLMEEQDTPRYSKAEQPGIFYVSDMMDQLGSSKLIDANPLIGSIGTRVGNTRTHWAISAKDMLFPGRSRGIVVVVGTDGVKDLKTGDRVVIDGPNRRIIVFPPSSSPKLYASFLQATVRGNIRDEIYQRFVQQKVRNRTLAQTADGFPIHFMTDIARLSPDASLVSSFGGDGVALYRSEKNFMGKRKEPSEDELMDGVLRAADNMSGPLFVRALDMANDKLQDMTSIRDHPDLGKRTVTVTEGGKTVTRVEPLYEGARFLVKDKKGRAVLELQLRAYIRAYVRSKNKNIKIFFPKVQNAEEARALGEMIEKVKGDLIAEGKIAKADLAGLEFGAAVETVTAANRAREIFETGIFDFANVGTNDTARDAYDSQVARESKELEQAFQGLHRPFLDAVELTARGVSEYNQAHPRHKIPIYFCGEYGNARSFLIFILGLAAKYHGLREEHKSGKKRLFISPVSNSYNVGKLVTTLSYLTLKEALEIVSSENPAAAIAQAIHRIEARIDADYGVEAKVREQVQARLEAGLPVPGSAKSEVRGQGLRLTHDLRGTLAGVLSGRQTLALRALLTVTNDLQKPPVPGDAARGAGGLLAADRVLKKLGAVGIVIGGVSRALYRNENIENNGDIDVLILTPERQWKGGLTDFEAGIDWFWPRGVRTFRIRRVNSQGREIIETLNENIYANANGIFLRAPVRSYADSLEAGLYLPGREFLADLTKAVALAAASRDSQATDEEVEQSFGEVIAEDLGAQPPAGWLALPGLKEQIFQPGDHFVGVGEPFEAEIVEAVVREGFADVGRRKYEDILDALQAGEQADSAEKTVTGATAPGMRSETRSDESHRVAADMLTLGALYRAAEKSWNIALFRRGLRIPDAIDWSIMLLEWKLGIGADQRRNWHLPRPMDRKGPGTFRRSEVRGRGLEMAVFGALAFLGVEASGQPVITQAPGPGNNWTMSVEDLSGTNQFSSYRIWAADRIEAGTNAASFRVIERIPASGLGVTTWQDTNQPGDAASRFYKVDGQTFADVQNPVFAYSRIAGAYVDYASALNKLRFPNGMPINQTRGAYVPSADGSWMKASDAGMDFMFHLYAMTHNGILPALGLTPESVRARLVQNLRTFGDIMTEYGLRNAQGHNTGIVPEIMLWRSGKLVPQTEITGRIVYSAYDMMLTAHRLMILEEVFRGGVIPGIQDPEISALAGELLGRMNFRVYVDSGSKLHQLVRQTPGNPPIVDAGVIDNLHTEAREFIPLVWKGLLGDPGADLKTQRTQGLAVLNGMKIEYRYVRASPGMVAVGNGDGGLSVFPEAEGEQFYDFSGLAPLYMGKSHSNYRSAAQYVTGKLGLPVLYTSPGITASGTAYKQFGLMDYSVAVPAGTFQALPFGFTNDVERADQLIGLAQSQGAYTAGWSLPDSLNSFTGEAYHPGMSFLNQALSLEGITWELGRQIGERMPWYPFLGSVMRDLDERSPAPTNLPLTDLTTRFSNTGVFTQVPEYEGNDRTLDNGILTLTYNLDAANTYAGFYGKLNYTFPVGSQMVMRLSDEVPSPRQFKVELKKGGRVVRDFWSTLNPAPFYNFSFPIPAATAVDEVTVVLDKSFVGPNKKGRLEFMDWYVFTPSGKSEARITFNDAPVQKPAMELTMGAENYQAGTIQDWQVLPAGDHGRSKIAVYENSVSGRSEARAVRDLAEMDFSANRVMQTYDGETVVQLVGGKEEDLTVLLPSDLRNGDFFRIYIRDHAYLMFEYRDGRFRVTGAAMNKTYTQMVPSEDVQVLEIDGGQVSGGEFNNWDRAQREFGIAKDAPQTKVVRVSAPYVSNVHLTVGYRTHRRLDGHPPILFIQNHSANGLWMTPEDIERLTGTKPEIQAPRSEARAEPDEIHPISQTSAQFRTVFKVPVDGDQFALENGFPVRSAVEYLYELLRSPGHGLIVIDDAREFIERMAVSSPDRIRLEIDGWLYDLTRSGVNIWHPHKAERYRSTDAALRAYLEHQVLNVLRRIDDYVQTEGYDWQNPAGQLPGNELMEDLEDETRRPGPWKVRFTRDGMLVDTRVAGDAMRARISRNGEMKVFLRASGDRPETEIPSASPRIRNSLLLHGKLAYEISLRKLQRRYQPPVALPTDYVFYTDTANIRRGGTEPVPVKPLFGMGEGPLNLEDLSQKVKQGLRVLSKWIDRGAWDEGDAKARLHAAVIAIANGISEKGFFEGTVAGDVFMRITDESDRTAVLEGLQAWGRLANFNQGLQEFRVFGINLIRMTLPVTERDHLKSWRNTWIGGLIMGAVMVGFDAALALEWYLSGRIPSVLTRPQDHIAFLAGNLTMLILGTAFFAVSYVTKKIFRAALDRMFVPLFDAENSALSIRVENLAVDETVSGIFRIFSRYGYEVESVSGRSDQLMVLLRSSRVRGSAEAERDLVAAEKEVRAQLGMNTGQPREGISLSLAVSAPARSEVRGEGPAWREFGGYNKTYPRFAEAIYRLGAEARAELQEGLKLPWYKLGGMKDSQRITEWLLGFFERNSVGLPPELRNAGVSETNAAPLIEFVEAALERPKLDGMEISDEGRPYRRFEAELRELPEAVRLRLAASLKDPWWIWLRGHFETYQKMALAVMQILKENGVAVPVDLVMENTVRIPSRNIPYTPFLDFVRQALGVKEPWDRRLWRYLGSYPSRSEVRTDSEASQPAEELGTVIGRILEESTGAVGADGAKIHAAIMRSTLETLRDIGGGTNANYVNEIILLVVRGIQPAIEPSAEFRSYFASLLPAIGQAAEEINPEKGYTGGQLTEEIARIAELELARFRLDHTQVMNGTPVEAVYTMEELVESINRLVANGELPQAVQLLSFYDAEAKAERGLLASVMRKISRSDFAGAREMLTKIHDVDGKVQRLVIRRIVFLSQLLGLDIAGNQKAIYLGRVTEAARKPVLNSMTLVREMWKSQQGLHGFFMLLGGEKLATEEALLPVRLTEGIWKPGPEGGALKRAPGIAVPIESILAAAAYFTQFRRGVIGNEAEFQEFLDYAREFYQAIQGLFVPAQLGGILETSVGNLEEDAARIHEAILELFRGSVGVRTVNDALLAAMRGAVPSIERPVPLLLQNYFAGMLRSLESAAGQINPGKNYSPQDLLQAVERSAAAYAEQVRMEARIVAAVQTPLETAIANVPLHYPFPEEIPVWRQIAVVLNSVIVSAETGTWSRRAFLEVIAKLPVLVELVPLSARSEVRKDPDSKIRPEVNAAFDWEKRRVDLDKLPDHPVKRFLVWARGKNLSVAVTGGSLLSLLYGGRVRDLDLLPVVPVTDAEKEGFLNGRADLRDVLDSLKEKELDIMRALASALGVRASYESFLRNPGVAMPLREFAGYEGHPLDDGPLGGDMLLKKAGRGKRPVPVWRMKLVPSSMAISAQGEIFADESDIVAARAGRVGILKKSGVEVPVRNIFNAIRMKHEYGLEFDGSVARHIAEMGTFDWVFGGRDISGALQKIFVRIGEWESVRRDFERLGLGGLLAGLTEAFWRKVVQKRFDSGVLPGETGFSAEWERVMSGEMPMAADIGFRSEMRPQPRAGLFSAEIFLENAVRSADTVIFDRAFPMSVPKSETRTKQDSTKGLRVGIKIPSGMIERISSATGVRFHLQDRYWFADKSPRMTYRDFLGALFSDVSRPAPKRRPEHTKLRQKRAVARFLFRDGNPRNGLNPAVVLKTSEGREILNLDERIAGNFPVVEIGLRAGQLDLLFPGQPDLSARGAQSMVRAEARDSRITEDNFDSILPFQTWVFDAKGTLGLIYSPNSYRHDGKLQIEFFDMPSGDRRFALIEKEEVLSGSSPLFFAQSQDIENRIRQLLEQTGQPADKVFSDWVRIQQSAHKAYREIGINPKTVTFPKDVGQWIALGNVRPALGLSSYPHPSADVRDKIEVSVRVFWDFRKRRNEIMETQEPEKSDLEKLLEVLSGTERFLLNYILGSWQYAASPYYYGDFLGKWIGTTNEQLMKITEPVSANESDGLKVKDEVLMSVISRISQGDFKSIRYWKFWLAEHSEGDMKETVSDWVVQAIPKVEIVLGHLSEAMLHRPLQRHTPVQLQEILAAATQPVAPDLSARQFVIEELRRLWNDGYYPSGSWLEAKHPNLVRLIKRTSLFEHGLKTAIQEAGIPHYATGLAGGRGMYTVTREALAVRLQEYYRRYGDQGLEIEFVVQNKRPLLYWAIHYYDSWPRAVREILGREVRFPQISMNDAETAGLAVQSARVELEWPPAARENKAGPVAWDRLTDSDVLDLLYQIEDLEKQKPALSPLRGAELQRLIDVFQDEEIGRVDFDQGIRFIQEYVGGEGANVTPSIAERRSEARDLAQTFMVQILEGNVPAEKLEASAEKVRLVGVERLIADLQALKQEVRKDAAKTVLPVSPKVIESEIQAIVDLLVSLKDKGYAVGYISPEAGDAAVENDFAEALGSLPTADQVLIFGGRVSENLRRRLAVLGKVPRPLNAGSGRNLVLPGDGQAYAGVVSPAQETVRVPLSGNLIPVTGVEQGEDIDPLTARYVITLQTAMAVLLAHQVKDENQKKVLLLNPAELLKNYNLGTGFENQIVQASGNGLRISTAAVRAYLEWKASQQVKTAA